MGNPNPVLPDRFIESQFKPEGDVALDRRPVKVKLPVSVGEAVRKLSSKDRAKWLRQVIIEAVKEENLI